MVKFAKDIAVAAHHFASEVLGGVYRAVRLLASAASRILARFWPGSRTDHAAVGRERDFDYRLMVN